VGFKGKFIGLHGISLDVIGILWDIVATIKDG
jgi:hypothetical protein